MSVIDNVLQIANNEVGYLEKKNNNQLYDKTANAGSNNYTKYWKDMYPGMQANPWCLCFVVWCFVQAFGQDIAKKLLCMTKGYTFYTPTSYDYFKKAGRVVKDPKAGDIIFFSNGTRICHVGMVTDVTSSNIFTIEGNTSGGSTLVANGGGVAKKSYSRSYSRIAGFCRPDYSSIDPSVKPTSTTSTPKYNYSYNDFVNDICSILKVTTVSEAFNKTISLSSSRNKNHPLVTPIEKYLKALGYYSGPIEADNKKTPIFGSGLANAVKSYQKKVVKATGKNVDGIISAKGPTWKKLLNI